MAHQGNHNEFIGLLLPNLLSKNINIKHLSLLLTFLIMSSSLYKICFIRRRPDLTEEQFYDYWRNVHAPKIAYWSKKHGLIGYTQVDIPLCRTFPCTSVSKLTLSYN